MVIEHKNDISDWTDEVIKLVHIKCPLKVSSFMTARQSKAVTVGEISNNNNNNHG
ncbi:hypothetical protein [Butyrivibrio sp. AE3004]|uniref:hypothetical protein n=1 Tax=Butyrivibrio sp. AE3004 TaxID=1506994 RepID=UPI000AD8EED7|nr:hypothetical protein [Butyrivibrio sp. AE3004]